MYAAWLCYPHQFFDDDDLTDNEPEIKFEQPEEWKYETIQFSVLHCWTDKRLYK